MGTAPLAGNFDQVAVRVAQDSLEEIVTSLARRGMQRTSRQHPHGQGFDSFTRPQINREMRMAPSFIRGPISHLGTSHHLNRRFFFEP